MYSNVSECTIRYLCTNVCKNTEKECFTGSKILVVEGERTIDDFDGIWEV